MVPGSVHLRFLQDPNTTREAALKHSRCLVPKLALILCQWEILGYCSEYAAVHLTIVLLAAWLSNTRPWL
jgi:hypothetical protein